jgi:multidrug resistance protein
MALTILIDFTGFGLVLPLLPFWAQHLGANAVGIGLATTAYALAQLMFTPLLGKLSDRYGRKPVILVSLFIESTSLVLVGIAGSYTLLLLGRFIGGVGASNIGSAQAVVADVTRPDQRARGMGMIGAAIGLGFVLGPALGGILAQLGPQVPFWSAAVVALLNAVLVLFLLPETRKPQSQPAGHQRNLRQSWLNVRNYPVVLRLVLINLLFTIAFTQMETALPLLAQRNLGWGAVQLGYIFAMIGVIIVIMQGGLVGQLVKRWNERSIMIVGLFLLAAGLLTLVVGQQLAFMLIGLGVLSIGDGAVTPLVSTLLSFASPEEHHGEFLGLSQGIGGLGRVLGPLLAGSIFNFVGPDTPFIIGSLLVIVAALIALPAMPTLRYKTSQKESIPAAQ